MSRIGSNSAKMGILTYQEAMDVTSNNIANVNTDGFKPFRASLADLIYTPRDPENEDVQRGHGVRLFKNDLLFTQGAMKETGMPLDFFAENSALFSVEDPSGGIYYTKDGSFQVTQNAGGEWELTDGANSYVLDANGEHIVVPYKLDGEGEPTAELDFSGISDIVGLFSFANPQGLRTVGDNYYAETDESGEPAEAERNIRSGYLEISDSELSRQMTEVIINQRAFSMNVNMYKTFSEMNSAINSLKN
ncbi:MAG: flagellar hook-basal body protein [Ruminococcus sp.]|jgi:flagellar basal-body rod protein FlgG|nr:flagellar hook-basal body protein [Ruminococcus sp.]